MIFPLHLVKWEDQNNRYLMAKSVDNWLSLGDGLTGFSLTGASSMNSLINRPESAFGNITELLATRITPNTFYYEGFWPCGETPPAAASAMQDWVIQSWDNKINVFPAVDDTHIDSIAFYNLRAEGAFLISSQRVNGTTQFIQIESLAGEPCILQTDIPPPYKTDPPNVVIKILANGDLLIGLEVNQTVVITSASSSSCCDFVISPVIGDPSMYNFWGFH